jgi:hypothetical protein
MSRTLGRVVAMRTKMPACRTVITGDHIPLDTRRAELKCLVDFGHKSIMNAVHAGIPQSFIQNHLIASPLVPVVVNGNRPAVDFTHKARLLAATLFIVSDQSPTQFRLEDPWNDKDRSGNVRQRSRFQTRQRSQSVHHRVDMVFGDLRERDDRDDAQAFVEHEGLGRVIRIVRSSSNPVQRADPSVEIPKQVDARHLFLNPPRRFILWINADSEEAAINIVKDLAT